MVDDAGKPRYRDYADYIVRHERAPGVGLLAGWRGDDGGSTARAPPTPASSSATSTTAASGITSSPDGAQYFKMANRDYLAFAVQAWVSLGSRSDRAAAVFGDAAEIPPRRARPRRGPAAAERTRAARAAISIRCRSGTRRAEQAGDRRNAYDPLHAVTQRPMFMYHSWGSQNAWLRQITSATACSCIARRPRGSASPTTTGCGSRAHTAASPCRCKLVDGVKPDTVWTWNAIGKRRGAWKLDADAPEAEQGFLLNHADLRNVTARRHGQLTPTADPITGQAAWFDLRVRCANAWARNADFTEPQFAALPPPPAWPTRRAVLPLAALSRRRARTAMTSLPAATRRNRVWSSTSIPASAAMPAHGLQGMEHRRPHGAADRSQTVWRRSRTASGSTACTPMS